VGVEQHDVVRINVAMNDSAAMGGLEGCTPLPNYVKDAFRRKSSLLDKQMAQATALEQLHNNVCRTIAILAEIMYDDGIGMMQHGCSARFTVEPLPRLRIVDHFRPQNLDCDCVAYVQATRPIDIAHPPTADARIQLITAAKDATDGHS
jgi:hypothetical protein